MRSNHLEDTVKDWSGEDVWCDDCDSGVEFLREIEKIYPGGFSNTYQIFRCKNPSCTKKIEVEIPE